MEEVRKVLQAEIIQSLTMKLEYEKIRLQALKDNETNLSVDLMIKFYDNRVREFERACEILNKASEE